MPQSMDTPQSQEDASTPHSAIKIIGFTSMEPSDELIRTDKRILWTQEEDLRLMSAWLHNSTDPTLRADRKNEQYWSDVAETYNQNTPSHRKRNPKQAKDRWHKVNKWMDLFHNAWLKARIIYSSGHSDQMWIDKAHHFYEDDNKDLKLGHLVLMDVWYAVRNEPKWITYDKGLKEARKRKTSYMEKGVEEKEHIDIEEDEECARPMGQKKAKKAALAKKGKSKTTDNDIEELNTFARLQSEEHANRLKAMEIQQKLSQEKIEANKLSHLASKERKEASMFETYNRLLAQDVGQLNDEEKADRAQAMKFLKKKLFTE